MCLTMNLQIALLHALALLQHLLRRMLTHTGTAALHPGPA